MGGAPTPKRDPIGCGHLPPSGWAPCPRCGARGSTCARCRGSTGPRRGANGRPGRVQRFRRFRSPSLDLTWSLQEPVSDLGGPVTSQNGTNTPVKFFGWFGVGLQTRVRLHDEALASKAHRPALSTTKKNHERVNSSKWASTGSNPAPCPGRLKPRMRWAAFVAKPRL